MLGSELHKKSSASFTVESAANGAGFRKGMYLRSDGTVVVNNAAIENTDEFFNNYGLPSKGHVKFKTNIGKVIFLLLLNQMMRHGYTNLDGITHQLRKAYNWAFTNRSAHIKSSDQFEHLNVLNLFNGVGWSYYGKNAWPIQKKSSKPEISEPEFVKNVLRYSNISTKLVNEGFIHKWTVEYYKDDVGWSPVKESIIKLSNHDRRSSKHRTTLGAKSSRTIKSIRRTDRSNPTKTEFGRFGSGLETSDRRRRATTP